MAPIAVNKERKKYPNALAIVGKHTLETLADLSQIYDVYGSNFTHRIVGLTREKQFHDVNTVIYVTTKLGRLGADVHRTSCKTILSGD